jgi:hypothetical protein
MDKLDVVADVYKGDVLPEDWGVTAIDPSGDGGIFTAIFSGPTAEEMALEYASEKFTAFQRRD